MNDSSPTPPKTPCGGNCACASAPNDDANSTRRAVLKGLGATLGVAAYAKALAPLTELTKETSMDEFLQKHYKELTKEEIATVITRLTKRRKTNTVPMSPSATRSRRKASNLAMH